MLSHSPPLVGKGRDRKGCAGAMGQGTGKGGASRRQKGRGGCAGAVIVESVHQEVLGEEPPAQEKSGKERASGLEQSKGGLLGEASSLWKGKKEYTGSVIIVGCVGDNGPGEEPPVKEKGGKRCASAVERISHEEEPQLRRLGAIFYCKMERQKL